jgi:hypothetical protein
MAVLSDSDRAALHTSWMQDLSSSRSSIATLAKAQLRAAIDAADQWADDNASSYNTALPVAARNNLTAKQKAQLLMFVIRRRYEVS